MTDYIKVNDFIELLNAIFEANSSESNFKVIKQSTDKLFFANC